MLHAGLAIDHALLFLRPLLFQLLDPAHMVVSELCLKHTRSFDMQAVECECCLCAARVTYGRTLETSTFQFSTPDFVYMLMFGMACMLVRYALVLHMHMPKAMHK